MIDEDRAAAEEIGRATSQRTVPVTEIQFAEGEPEYVIGFDLPLLTRLLGTGR